MKTGFIGGKFLPLHLGHLYAIIEAHNQVDKLYIVLSSSIKRDKELCQRDGIKYMPAEVRMSWIGEAVNDLDNIEIINIIDTQNDADYNWEQGAKLITAAIPEKITHVFSSEEDYTDLFNRFYPFAKHIVIDAQRTLIPISATKIRKNIYAHWEKLPPYVRGFFTKKIALVGTESVGKSTLTKKLAKFYSTSFIPEIGRDYCEKYKNNLTVPMFDSIAMKHFVAQQDALAFCDKILFVDSDAVITKYYLDMYCNAESKLIDQIIPKQNFDLCLYLEPDIPWQQDGFRFAGQSMVRQQNNMRLKLMYTLNNIEYQTISGTFSERFNQARKLINNL